MTLKSRLAKLESKVAKTPQRVQVIFQGMSTTHVKDKFIDAENPESVALLIVVKFVGSNS